MGTFLLALFLVFIVWPLVKFLWAIRKAHKQARKAFEQATGTQWKQYKKESKTPPVNKEKIFDKNVGEYVDFEDIETASATTTENTTQAQQAKIEHQIEDAEWEEIK